MIGPFSFEHDGRNYHCTVERRTAAPAGDWWWFSVSQDQQRYSSFEAAAKDTQTSVKKRVIEYYEHVLKVRARPPELRPVGRPPGRPKAVPKDDLLDD
jgi:hypothetical protein